MTTIWGYKTKLKHLNLKEPKASGPKLAGLDTADLYREHWSPVFFLRSCLTVVLVHCCTPAETQEISLMVLESS